MYYLNEDVPLPTEYSKESIVNRHRELCHEAQTPGNYIDFNSIPTMHLFEYRNLCYDLQNIMNYFNFNWNKPNFCFTIDRMHCASFQTMEALATQVTSYNVGIQQGFSGPQFSYFIGDKSHIRESIVMDLVVRSSKA